MRSDTKFSPNDNSIRARRIGNSRWHVLDDSLPASLLQALNGLSPEQIEEHKLLAKRKGRIAFLHQVTERDKAVFVKLSWPRHVGETIKYLFKITRAAQEFQGWTLLDSLQFEQPRLLAMGETRTLGVWRQSWLVYDYIENAQTLLQLGENLIDGVSRRRAVMSLAELVARLHNHCIYYADLHSGNVILVHKDGEEIAHNAKLLLVDAYELRQKFSLQFAQRADDLARLNGFVKASRQERLRFLCAYGKQVNFSKQQQQQLLQDVDQRTRVLWRQYKQRRGIDRQQYA